MVGTSSHTPKGCGFYFWSQHIPRLRVRSSIRVYAGGSQSTFLTMFLSPLTSPKSTSISSSEDFFKVCITKKRRFKKKTEKMCLILQRKRGGQQFLSMMNKQMERGSGSWLQTEQAASVRYPWEQQ